MARRFLVASVAAMGLAVVPAIGQDLTPAVPLFVTGDDQTVFTVRRPPNQARGWVLCNANGDIVVAEDDCVPLLNAQDQPLRGDGDIVQLLLMPKKTPQLVPRSGMRFSRSRETQECEVLDHEGRVIDLGLGNDPLFVTDLPEEEGGVAMANSDTRFDTGPDATTTRIERDVLEDPATLNKAVDILLRPEGRALLAGIDFQFKAFEGEDGQAALGFSYDWSRSWSGISPEDGPNFSGGSIDLRARGNVAFGQDFNPSDFLDTHVTGRWFWSHGGYAGQALTDAAFMQAMKDLDDEWDAGWGTDADWEQSLRSPRFQERVRSIRQRLGTQVHTDVGLDAGFETDQRFTARNLTGGIVVRLDVKAWDPNSWLAKANLLDWPFAALRFLTGYDRSFEMRGSTLPTLLVAAEQVFPQADDPRTLLGDESDYLRLRGEASFRTPIGLVGDRQVFFNADFRYFHEVDASAVVRTAALDSYHYVSLSLTASDGFFVAYKSGHLPFAMADQDIYELGWQFSF